MVSNPSAYDNGDDGLKFQSAYFQDVDRNRF